MGTLRAGRRTGRGPVRCGRSWSRSGFTLLELAIALTLLTTVFVGLNRFALSGLSASSTNIELADLRRQISFTRSLLDADLSQARACDPSGYGSPFLHLDTDGPVKRFALYTTATARGSAELVEWRFYPDGRVYRLSTISALGANLCDAIIDLDVGEGGGIESDLAARSERTGEELQLELISPARNVFAAEVRATHRFPDANGEMQEAPRGSGELCVGWRQSDCYADRIAVSFLLITSGFDPITTRIQWVFDVNLTNARM